MANPVPFVRDLITGALAAEGHETIPASTAGEVDALLTEQRSVVDLVVIDSSFIRSDIDLVPADIPVVVTGPAANLTGLDVQGAVRVLDEPLSLAVLTRSVAALLPSSDLLVRR